MLTLLLVCLWLRLDGIQRGGKNRKRFWSTTQKTSKCHRSYNTHQNSDSAEVDAGGVVESRAGTAGTEMAELITKANILRK